MDPEGKKNGKKGKGFHIKHLGNDAFSRKYLHPKESVPTQIEALLIKKVSKEKFKLHQILDKEDISPLGGYS